MAPLNICISDVIMMVVDVCWRSNITMLLMRMVGVKTFALLVDISLPGQNIIMSVGAGTQRQLT